MMTSLRLGVVSTVFILAFAGPICSAQDMIFDSVKLGDGHHDDFFQSHMGANPDTSSDVEITGNTVRNNITTRNLSGGENNIEVQQGDEHLFFSDWEGLDLSLAPGSPAIDAGNPDGATAYDVEGTARDTQPDVGAYEYVPPK